MQTEARAQGKVGVLPETIAGAAAYLTFIPAIIFLLLEPYKKNRFVRFHSVQCLAFWGTLIGLAIVLKLAGLLLYIIPVLGPLLVVLVWTVIAIAAVGALAGLSGKGAARVICSNSPLLGDFAAQQAGAI